MASQITHIRYAKVVRDKFLANKQIDEAKFYIGNMFSDIRYLGGISRESTHANNPTIEGLLEIDSSFELGMYCHALIDRKREETLNRLGFYDLLPGNKFLPYAMKFIEDVVVYSRVQNWTAIASYFETILEKETELVSQDSVTKWHGLIRNYFCEPPNRKTMASFVEGLGFDASTIESVVEVVEEIKKNKKAMRLIEMTEESLFR